MSSFTLVIYHASFMLFTFRSIKRSISGDERGWRTSASLEQETGFIEPFAQLLYLFKEISVNGTYKSG